MKHGSVLRTRRYDVGKRAIDVVVAAVGLVLTAPLQAVIALLVARRMGRPVLFRQQRPGKDGKPFVLVKFRTMREANASSELVTDAQRLTTLGTRLRSTSLDELPTLWNVLRGDMSLVGPRPLMMQYLDRYTPEEARRHELRPGITGLAQVLGRNHLTWSEKFAADVEYVQKASFTLDARILLKTATTVVRRQGIRPPDGEIMPEYFRVANARD